MPTLISLAWSIPSTDVYVRAEPVVEKVELRKELISICTCESGLKQFKSDGSVVRGIVNNQDIGMCQINLTHHGDMAEKLGFDVFTEEGNIKYSNWLYEQQGSTPWNWSKSCWNK